MIMFHNNIFIIIVFDSNVFYTYLLECGQYIQSSDSVMKLLNLNRIHYNIVI